MALALERDQPGEEAARGGRWKVMPQRMAEAQRPRIAPLSKAASLFGVSRKCLYSMLFSPVHPTPEGLCWKLRGRHWVDVDRLEIFLRGQHDAK
jgi:hypothetical protein